MNADAAEANRAAITTPLQRFVESHAPATHDMCQQSGNTDLIRVHLRSSAANKRLLFRVRRRASHAYSMADGASINRDVAKRAKRRSGHDAE